MNLKNSFIVKMFGILLALFILLLCGVGISLYKYARNTVGDEIQRLNQASLKQLSEMTGAAISNVVNFAEQTADNSRIHQAIEKNDKNSEKSIHNTLSALQSEYTVSHSNGRMRLEVAVISEKGIFASASNTGRYDWENFISEDRMSPFFTEGVQTQIFPTQKTDYPGIMKYSFQIVTAINDLLSGEHLGFVIVDVSELLLYEQYKDYLKNGVSMSVVDRDDFIISAKNKMMIGSKTDDLRGDSGGARQIRLYEEIPGTPWILIEMIPENNVFGSLVRLKYVIMVLAGLTIILCGIATIITSKTVQKRVDRLRNKMTEFMNGDLSVRITVEQDDEFGQIEESFNSMVSEINHLLTRTKESEHQKRTAEMDFLNAQINSHFIHNTLTSIRFMLEMGQVDEAGEMIFYFSKLLRRTLSRSDEFISLADEIDTLKSYFSLQRFRYPNKFEVTYNVPDETLAALVPTLIMQPVAENSIFHGTRHELMHIVISAIKEGNDLILCVEDDGIGMTEEKTRTILQKDAPMNRVGLRNVHDRIQMNYGQNYGLKVESHEGSGTKITFLLPFDLPKEGD